MKIDDFTLENWLNPACDSEKNKVYLGGSCVSPMTVRELFDVIGEDMDSFLKKIPDLSLAYPYFTGTPLCREGVAGLYRKVEPEDVVLVHGGTGANDTVVQTLLEPGDSIISIVPNYQQFVSIPKSIGVEVREVHLKPEEGYRLDLDEVRDAVSENTKAIMFTNPNNPTGALLPPDVMEEMTGIAKDAGCWIVCDEMYRGLKEGYNPSFTDYYDKTIVTASSSKIFSMAGLRVGWIVCRDPEMRWNLFNRRSYNSICGGVFDEWLFGIALQHKDKIFERSRGIVNRNKKIIDEWVERQPLVHQYAEGWATTYLIHYDLDVGAEKFCDDLLDQKGVLVCHGDCFQMPHTFRITLSSDVETLKEGLRLIDEYMQELIAGGVPILGR
ncbi:MAG: aminotransferase class I/II-fold pyridoxal phosphate-dependent enzyme [Anaerovoracaceae bacterium]|jgi:aspartate/methionine/tyrosine aminotransferase